MKRLIVALTLFAAIGLRFAVTTARSATTDGAAQSTTPAHTRITGWGDKLKEAGTVGVVQFGLSAFGAIFIFERLFGLRRKHVVPPELTARAKKLWAEGKFEVVEKLGDMVSRSQGVPRSSRTPPHRSATHSPS